MGESEAAPTHVGALGVRDRVDEVLEAFLQARRSELSWIDERATEPLDEVVRLVEAGGKRIRPAFCYWGFRAAGGQDGTPIVHAAAAFELLHAMALIHDDVMDGTPTRRGQPAAHVRQEADAARRGAADPRRVGAAVAILCGDLAAVLADQLLLEAGFPPERLTVALARYHRMRVEMAAGQYLDLAGASADARRLAHLKGGSYTVVGPLLVGSALADGPAQVEARLERYGEPLGQAFQLLDDLADGDAAPGVTEDDARRLVAGAKAALDPAVMSPEVVGALEELADVVAG